MLCGAAAVVVPVAIIGNYKPFRKMIVSYGEPIDLTAIIDESSPDMLEQVTDAVMTRIRELAAKPSLIVNYVLNAACLAYAARLNKVGV